MLLVDSANESRRFALAQIYDEIIRKEWSEKASRGFILLGICLCSQPLFLSFVAGDAGFDVDKVCYYKDNDVLNRARNVFDAAGQAAKQASLKKTAPPKLLDNRRAPLFLFMLCICCIWFGRRVRSPPPSRKRVFQRQRKRQSGGYNRQGGARNQSWRNNNGRHW